MQLDAAADANIRRRESPGQGESGACRRPEAHQLRAASGYRCSEVTGTQTLTFNINVSQINGTFFEIDGQPYDGNRIDRTLRWAASMNGR